MFNITTMILALFEIFFASKYCSSFKNQLLNSVPSNLEHSHFAYFRESRLQG